MVGPKMFLAGTSTLKGIQLRQLGFAEFALVVIALTALTGDDDIICGEGGNDRIHGGSDDDQMWGEAFRDDPLIGVPGNDDINGGSGSDLLVDPVGIGQTLSGGFESDRVLWSGTLKGGSRY